MSSQPKPAPPATPKTPASVLAADIPPCPECWAGSHQSCTNKTWDRVADDFAPCPCAKADHLLRAHQEPK